MLFSRWRACAGAAVVVAIAVTIPGGTLAQAPSGAWRPSISNQSGGGSGPLSPSVSATFRARTQDSELYRLDFLVLWRGEPGWLLKIQRWSSGGSRREWTSVQQLDGFQLEVQVDLEALSGEIAGTPVDLRTANVFLVDGVGDPAGPVIVDSYFIEAGLRPGRGVAMLLPILRAVPELRDYLRCDTPAANWPVGAQIPDMCRELSL